MQYGFKELWKKTISKEDASPESWDVLKKCAKISVLNNDGYSVVKELTRKELEKGNVEITGQYDGLGLSFELSPTQKTFLSTHGWVLFDPWNNRNMRWSENLMLDQEERWLYYQRIWGRATDYQRYPYNTVFVTTDMMLHFYHKIFSNSLRYYEESKARNIMVDLSTAMFTKFSQLYQQNIASPLAPYYAYATAYWAIPHILLLSENEITTQIDKKTQASTDWSTDLNDADINTLSMNTLARIQSQIPQTYQAAVTTTLQNIFEASQSRAPDSLLAVLGWTSSGVIDVQQDYTQFTPRSHYTNSSLLKTYFMGMKRFMREKLYFNDSQQATTALLMINNIKNWELEQFSQLYDFIQKLIGQDDDVNIKDLQTFIAAQWRTSDKNITAGVTPNIQAELKKIRPQKILSTHYQTPDIQMVTEQDAKDELAWFVFFGEKFTIDSRIFDRMTAGTAEKESTYKPSVQTSLIVPDGLINTWFISDLVGIRMQQAQSKYWVNEAQVAWYTQAKQETQSWILAQDFSVSTYHQWLDGLWRLFALSDPNRPYFMQDPLWQYKDLNTFQGNYTELKHDTLLYVKQAYAEMGWGWSDECSFYIDPPALPVPKGYIEPNIWLIDALLDLTQKTKQFFWEDQSFIAFSQFLSFAKTLAIKQTKNEIIDDQSYETLRLYADKLLLILYPNKVIEGWENDFISALIADIFTSEKNGPLYIANGRPYLLITNIKDINGTRAVIGPVYSTFEFYGSDAPISAQKGRYSDEDRRSWLDTLKKNDVYTLPMQKILQE